MKILTSKKIGGLLIICIIILGTLFITMQKQNTKCSISPFTFGANQLYENAHIKITCECRAENPQYKSFYFNRENITFIENPVYSIP